MAESQNTKNNLIYKNLVRNYWGLTDEAFKDFKNKLLYGRDIAKEYAHLLKDSKDLRARFPLDTKYYSNIDAQETRESDPAWTLFTKIIVPILEAKHIDFPKITYEDFTENKVDYKKNSIKIIKAAKIILKESINKIFNEKTNTYEFVDGFEGNVCLNIIMFFLIRAKQINIPTEGEFILRLIRGTTVNIPSNISRFRFHKINGIMNGETPCFESFEDFRTVTLNIFDKIVSIIGKYKKPNKHRYEIVISLNPVDWLMASTAERWSSCLSLDSNYFYWAGMPSLINDKNRAMVYITDGKKKKYEGIEVDRFITRSWLLTARKKKTSDVVIDLVREYPNNFNLDEVLNNMGILNNPVEVLRRFDSEERKKYISRYYIEKMPFRNRKKNTEIVSSIYLDSCSLKDAKKNKARKNPGKYFYYSYKSGGGLYVYSIRENNVGPGFLDDTDFEYGGLENVIHKELDEISSLFYY